MIADHANFSSLQFPSEWEQPRFKLGDAVMVDGKQGVIVGANYASPLSLNPEFNTEQFGWWFEVCLPHDTGSRILKNVMGFHQDVIQPVIGTVDTVARQQHGSITPYGNLEPLLYGAF